MMRGTWRHLRNVPSLTTPIGERSTTHVKFRKKPKHTLLYGSIHAHFMNFMMEMMLEHQPRIRFSCISLVFFFSSCCVSLPINLLDVSCAKLCVIRRHGHPQTNVQPTLGRLKGYQARKYPKKNPNWSWTRRIHHTYYFFFYVFDMFFETDDIFWSFFY